MANTERTYADLLAKGQKVASAIGGFKPTMVPADPSLVPAEFKRFVAEAGSLNELTNALKADYSTQAAERTAMVKDLKDRALRAFRYVQSNKAWAKHAASLKLTYDKLRGNRPKKPPLPPEATEAKQKKAIKTGQQSYGDLESLFRKLIAGLSKVPGYDPPAAELTLAELGTLRDAFADLNAAMGDLAGQLALRIRERVATFALMREKAVSIKAAVAAQYGQRSAQSASLRALKF